MSKRAPVGKTIKQPVEEVPQLPAPQRARNFLNPIQQKIFGELQQQTFNIAKKPRPYWMQKEQQDIDLSKLKKLGQKKSSIQQRLTQLQSLERKFEEDINIKKIMRDRNYSTLRPKSELTKEDALKLRKLKQQQRSFEKELEDKDRMIQEQERMHKIEQKELQWKIMQEKNEKKKEEIARKLQEMAEKRNFRNMRYEEENKELTRIKDQKKIFEEYAKNFEKVEEEENQKKIQAYEKRLRDRSIELGSLKEHEQKYSQIMKVKKQQLSKKRFEASRLHRSNAGSYQKSKFYNFILQQEQRIKNEEREKKGHNKQVADRMKDYAEVVKNNHVPKVKTKEDEENEQNQDKKSRTIVDAEQMRRMGLRYLEVSKTKASKKKKKEKGQLSDDRNSPKHRYIDYLSQTRNTRAKESDGSRTKFSKSFKNQVKEVREIMHQSNYPGLQKIEKVKMLAQKIQSTPQSLNSESMLHKISAKLELLSALQS